jgi:predicted deacylase
MSTLIYDPAQIDFDKPGKHHYRLAFHLDSSWGYSMLPLTVINGLRQSARETHLPGLAAFGGTHGNEWEGQVAIKLLREHLDPQEISGRVLLIPQLSPSACAVNQRISPLDNVNMNRAFPGNPRGTISSRIANFVTSYIFPRVHVVIDLHAGGREGGFALCTSFHPARDPTQMSEIAKIASVFDTPYMLIYSSQMASGLLTDEAEAQGKIAIGGEFGFGEGVNRKGVLHAHEGIKNVLRYYGMLTGEIAKIDPLRKSAPRLVDARNLEDYVPCPHAGVWEPLVDLGDYVQKEQIVGRLHNFSEDASQTLTLQAHRAGIMIMMSGIASCEQGATLFVIAQDSTLPNPS